MSKKFNPENKETLTLGECLDPAMEITDPKEASKYKSDYINFLIEKGLSREKALNIVNSNLAYYSGYYNTVVQKRVENLFESQRLGS